jgi:C1A family cysteine protease
MSVPSPTRFGWQPDLPDHRDQSTAAAGVRRLLKRLGYKRGRHRLPPSRDWRTYFRPPDAAAIGCGVAAACVSLVEYFERRATGRDRAGCAAFVQQVAASLQDGGPVGMRAALKAATQFGVPPNRLWLRGERDVAAPAGMLFAYAGAMRGARYVRLDPPGETGERVVRRVRAFLAGGFPCVLGFSVPGSVGAGPDIPFPTAFDAILGGRAAVVTGYDDEHLIRSAHGALLVQPAWGTDWGEGGYGRLPFEFLRRGLAADVWTILHPRWLKSGEFGWRD